MKKSGIKLCSSVSSDSGTDAKAGNPPRQKGINDSLCLDVHQGNHFRPAAESIHHREEISVASRRWEWHNDVHVQNETLRKEKSKEVSWCVIGSSNVDKICKFSSSRVYQRSSVAKQKVP